MLTACYRCRGSFASADQPAHTRRAVVCPFCGTPNIPLVPVNLHPQYAIPTARPPVAGRIVGLLALVGISWLVAPLFGPAALTVGTLLLVWGIVSAARGLHSPVSLLLRRSKKPMGVVTAAIGVFFVVWGAACVEVGNQVEAENAVAVAKPDAGSEVTVRPAGLQTNPVPLRPPVPVEASIEVDATPRPPPDSGVALPTVPGPKRDIRAKGYSGYTKAGAALPVTQEELAIAVTLGTILFGSPDTPEDKVMKRVAKKYRLRRDVLESIWARASEDPELWKRVRAR